MGRSGAGRTGDAEHGARADPSERSAVLEANGRRSHALPIGNEPRGGAAHPQSIPLPAGEI